MRYEVCLRNTLNKTKLSDIDHRNIFYKLPSLIKFVLVFCIDNFGTFPLSIKWINVYSFNQKKGLIINFLFNSFYSTNLNIYILDLNFVFGLFSIIKLVV